MNTQAKTFTPNHQLARNMAQAGLPVFPCLEADSATKGEKAPYNFNGFKKATTDISRIDRWWQQYPGAVVGMPTGDISGLSVVDGDIDKETGEAIGESQVEQLSLAHPDAVKVITVLVTVQW